MIIITAGFLLLTLAKTFHFTKTYGGTDLRCRIVGTRLLATNNSSYFYQWQPGDDVRYLDPNLDTKRIVNGNVVTPATMVAIYPISTLSYPAIRWIWAIAQVLAAAGILLILFRNAGFSNRFLLAIPILLGLICSDIWLYHIERGQMYIFYAFVITVMYAIYVSEWRLNEFGSGFIGGMFIFFRPFAAILGLGFLLHGKMQWIYGCISGFLVGALIFVAPFIPAWKDYFKAMDEYVKENTGQGHTVQNNSNWTPVITIEGSDNLKTYRHFTMDHLVLKRFGIKLKNNSSLIIYGIALLTAAFFFFRLRKRISSPETIFLFGFILLFLAEIFVLAPRAGYSVIQWIFPLSLIWIHGRRHLPTVILLVTGLLLLHQFPYKLPFQSSFAEIIFIGLTLYHIYFPGTIKKIQDGNG